MHHHTSWAFLFALVFACVQISGCGGSGTIGLMVTTTTLPDGIVNTPYSAVLMATGGAPPYFWIPAGTTPTPPGVNFSGANGPGTISGIPTKAGYFGPYGFTVWDSNNTTASSGPLYITIAAASSAAAENTGSSCAPLGNEAGLKSANPYAFLVKGTDSQGNPIDIAASFTPDANGGIANAAVDYNGITNGPEQLQVNLDGSSYAFGSSGEGCLSLVFSGPATTSTSVRQTGVASNFTPANITRARSVKTFGIPASVVSSAQFRFRLSDYDGTVYHTGRIIESDNPNGSGTNASGFMHVQTPGDFDLAALVSKYAFGVDGWTATPPGVLRTALAGTFTNRSGILSAGYADLNAGGTASGELTGGHGAFNSIIDATTGRGTASFLIATPSGDLRFDSVFYVLNGSDLILLSSDWSLGDGTVPLLAGRALASNATYNSESLSGYYLLASQGLAVNGSIIGNLAEIGTMNATGTGVIPTATIYSNLAGNFASNQYPNSSYIVESAPGRVSIMGLTATPPVVYLTTGNADDGIAGFVIGTDTEASSGEVIRQPAGLPNYASADVSGNFTASRAEDVDGLNGAFLTSFTFTGTGGYTVIPQLAGSTFSNLPHLGMISIRADGTGNLDGGRFPFVTNGAALFAIPDSGDPSLFVFTECTPPK